MKLIFCSKLKSDLLWQVFPFKKSDSFLVLPVCTMEQYVKDLLSWEEYFGDEGILTQKIQDQLCGAGAVRNRIDFYNYLSSEEIPDFNRYTCLVIPGGDAELGVERIKNKNLLTAIKNYQGIILAYSAGALMLYQEYFLSPNWYYTTIKYCRGIGLDCMPPFLLEMHYDGSESMASMIKEAGKYLNRDVYAIGDYGILFYDNYEKSIIEYGDVTYFRIQNQI